MQCLLTGTAQVLTKDDSIEFDSDRSTGAGAVRPSGDTSLQSPSATAGRTNRRHVAESGG